MKNIHILPTSQPSRLIIQNSNKLILGQEEYSIIENRQNIYITNDEKFVIDEYITDVIEVIKATPKLVDGQGLLNRRGWKKIILTTDGDLIKDGVQGIDDDFLEWFVQNPSCEEVEVKKGKMRLNCDGEEIGFPDMSLYKIIIPKEEPKLSNICIKCGVDLYALEGKFVCLKHPKECKGIYLSKETLLIHAAEQKQYLIDMMRNDEELGLYEEPKQETLEEAAHKMLINYGIKSMGQSIGVLEVKKLMVNFAKWQQERNYSEEDMKEAIRFGFDKGFCSNSSNKVKNTLQSEREWFKQFKKK